MQKHLFKSNEEEIITFYLEANANSVRSEMTRYLATVLIFCETLRVAYPCDVESLSVPISMLTSKLHSTCFHSVTLRDQ